MSYCGGRKRKGNSHWQSKRSVCMYVFGSTLLLRPEASCFRLHSLWANEMHRLSTTRRLRELVNGRFGPLPMGRFCQNLKRFFFLVAKSVIQTTLFKRKQKHCCQLPNDVVSPKIKAQNTKYSQFNSFPKSLKKTMRLFILAKKKKKNLCLYFIYIIFILKI